MKYSFLSIFSLFLAFLMLSCGKAEEVIAPTHYARVPKPVNLSASFDTTSTGKYRVIINWAVESTDNLKDFEIYRSVDNSNFFFLFGGMTTTSYIDSTLANTKDYSLGYFVNGRGIDRFVGQSSDTVKIVVSKSF